MRCRRTRLGLDQEEHGDGWGFRQVDRPSGNAGCGRRAASQAGQGRYGFENWEFKFWGKFASYKAYDPHLERAMLPIFVLQGYGSARPRSYPLSIKVGPPDRIQHRPSGASPAREGSSDFERSRA